MKRQRINPRSAIGLPLLALLPASSWACITCTESSLNHGVPNYYPLLGVLLLWFVGFVVADAKGLRLVKHPTGKPLWKRIMTSWTFWIMIPIAVFTGTAYPFFTMLIAFAWWGILQPFFKAETRAVHALNVGALVLALAVVGTGLYQRRGMDEFDVARATMISGSGPQRFKAGSFARDADFDLERLRPLINSESERDQAWTFSILQIRRNAEDLERFRSEIEALPTEYFDPARSSDSYGVGMFQSWLRKIEAEETLQSALVES